MKRMRYQQRVAQRVTVWLALTVWVLQVGCTDANPSSSSQPAVDAAAAVATADQVGPEAQQPGGVLGPGGLVELYEKYKDQNVLFVGLTAEGSSEIDNSRKFVEDLGIEWPNAYGASATIDALGVEALPTVLLAGPDGKVLWNDQLGGALDDAIQRALESAATR